MWADAEAKEVHSIRSVGKCKRRGTAFEDIQYILQLPGNVLGATKEDRGWAAERGSHQNLFAGYTCRLHKRSTAADTPANRSRDRLASATNSGRPRTHKPHPPRFPRRQCQACSTLLGHLEWTPPTNEGTIAQLNVLHQTVPPPPSISSRTCPSHWQEQGGGSAPLQQWQPLPPCHRPLQPPPRCSPHRAEGSTRSST